jgi:hypothetical protein
MPITENMKDKLMKKLEALSKEMELENEGVRLFVIDTRLIDATLFKLCILLAMRGKVSEEVKQSILDLPMW